MGQIRPCMEARTRFRRCRLITFRDTKSGSARTVPLSVTFHSAASFMVQAGVSLATVRAWLGHRSYCMTLRYAALAPEHLRDGADVMDRPFGNPGGLPAHSGADRGG